MKFRSPTELAFRLRQQIARRLDRNSAAPVHSGPLRPLPLPDVSGSVSLVRGTRLDGDLSGLAESIVAHRFPLFGKTIDTGAVIDWRRDYVNGISTPVAWFKEIPFLDFSAAGDHKNIWELNRHQHLVVLAQAWALGGDVRFLGEIEAQVTSWHEQNPFLRSVNWASALEVAFRALSWLWILHLTGTALPSSTRAMLGDLLRQHATAIEHNLSTYFAPNTHILGEGVALHAIGLVLGSGGWERAGANIVDRQLLDQVLPDGFHFELSSYYHLYALDMFLFHYLVAGRPARYEPVLPKMARCLSAMLDGDRNLPLIGDDDGGRFFHPYGTRAGFARATLATCAALFPNAGIAADPADFPVQGAWWVGSAAPGARYLPDLSCHLDPSGMTVFRRGVVHLSFDCGPFSRGGAGHSHADSLAMTLRIDGRDILIDPGTYTYVEDAATRDWFRGTGAHCTVRLGGRDQADPVKPFRWESKPSVRRLSVGEWQAAGECSFRQWVHRRRVDFEDPTLIRVTDEVSGTGQPGIEQLWHCGAPIVAVGDHRYQIGPAWIELDPLLQAEIIDGWRSCVFGSRERSQILRGWCEAPLVRPLTTLIHLDPAGGYQ